MRNVLAAVAIATAAVGGTIAGLAEDTPPRGFHTPADFAEDFAVNDGIPDNVAIQACMEAATTDGKPCVFGPGVHDVASRAQNLALGNPRRQMGLELFRSLQALGRHPLVLRGAGPSTVLRMSGNGHNDDWWMIGCYESDGLEISDMTLDSSGRTGGYDEQQHLINAHYGCKNVNIQRVRCHNPTLAPSGGGDCIRFVGSGWTPSGPPTGVVKTATGLSFGLTGIFGNQPQAGRRAWVTLAQMAPAPIIEGKLQFIGGVNRLVIEGYVGQEESLASLANADYVVGMPKDAWVVSHVTVRDVVGDDNDRSLIGIQRGLHEATFDKITDYCTGDQALDMEATGVVYTSDRIRNVMVRDFHIKRCRGGLGISIGHGDNIVVDGGTVEGGGIFGISCNNCSVRNSVFISDASNASPVYMRRSMDGFTMDNVRVVKVAGSTPASAVLFEADSDGAPRAARIINSMIIQETPSVGVFVRSSEVEILGTTIEYRGPTPPGSNAVAIVYNAATAPAVGGVTSNRITGKWLWAAHATSADLASTPAHVGVGPFRFVGNEINGAVNGLKCFPAGASPRVRAVVRGLNAAHPAVIDGCPLASAGY